MSNQSTVTYFLLMGVLETQTLCSVIFLFMYLVALIGNLLIISIIVFNPHLHTPMYFFVLNLCVTDFGYISVTIPKAMINSFMKSRQILYFHCVAQVFSFVLFGACEIFLLTIMAYDRYVAICQPLHYETVMSTTKCIQMACFSWLMGLLTSALHTGATFAISFCSNIINQFFCEIPKMLRLSCSDMYLIEIGAFAVSGSMYFICFLLVLLSYVQIFKAVMRIPTTHGRQKAFSTCLPHLIVLSMFYSSGLFAYAQPLNGTPSQMDLVVAVTYCVVPPFMNPIIYSMRNKDIKGGLWNLLNWRYSGKTIHYFT